LVLPINGNINDHLLRAAEDWLTMSPADSLPTESPLPRPPPGPSYVTVVPVELSFRLFVASIIFTVLVIIALVLRVLSRFYISVKLGWDDALVFGAAIFSFGQTVLFALCAYTSPRTGLGTDRRDILT
jgi:hypothetical protein